MRLHLTERMFICKNKNKKETDERDVLSKIRFFNGDWIMDDFI